ncbi:MAG: hypothetical protein P8L77_03650 [Gammaproteobacteria bacterium]|nr:hypothetical protein [Gammaproteobacteria bacterium]
MPNNKTPSEPKIPNEMFEKITLSLKTTKSFFENHANSIIDPLQVLSPLTIEDDINCFKEYFTKGDDLIWQQALKEERQVWHKLKPLGAYLLFNGSLTDVGINATTNAGAKELASLCITIASSAHTHNTNPISSLLFVQLSNQLVQVYHRCRLQSDESEFVSVQQYKLQLAYLISAIGILMFSLVLYGYTLGMLANTLLIVSSSCGFIISQTFIQDLLTYNKSIDTNFLFLYFNVSFFMISILTITALNVPILLTFCFIASFTPLVVQHFTNTAIRKFIREQPINEKDIRILNIILLDDLKPINLDNIGNYVTSYNFRRSIFTPNCYLERFKEAFKYEIFDQMYRHLPKTYAHEETLAGNSILNEVVQKSVFKENIEACRCQLQSMFRINKHTQSLEIITERYGY